MEIQANQAAADAVVTRLSTSTPNRGDFGHHISDLNACLRRRWLEHHQPPDGPNPLTLTFLRGSVLHDMLSGGVPEIELHVDDLIGTIDHIDPDGGLWEWKTTMIWAGKLDDPSAWPEPWLIQTAAYSFMAGSIRLSLPTSPDSLQDSIPVNVGVLHLQGDGRSNRLPILKVYRVTFTNQELLDNWLRLKSRSSLILSPTEPSVNTRLANWECKNCPYHPHCLPELTDSTFDTVRKESEAPQ